MNFSLLKSRYPWQNGLFTTTGIALFAWFSSMLWRAGNTDWAFVLAFVGTWLLISLIWSNDDYNEESSTILARIVDHNFEQLHDQCEELESRIEQLRSEQGRDDQKTA